MRETFIPGRRQDIPARSQTVFTIEAPPELPRTIATKAWKKALPFVFGAAIIAIMVVMYVSGARQMNPMYLLFMAMMGVGLFQSVGKADNAEMSTEEVDSERAEYLRYLSDKSQALRECADRQRANAEWSHPDPTLLEAVIGGSRMWERGPEDDDYLKIRVGRTSVQLANKFTVKPVDQELDLEPVCRAALQHMRAIQLSIPHCPKAIDMAGFGVISVYGDRDLFTAALRAWIGQWVTWHGPQGAAVAIASPQLEPRWGWAKWLPHTESTDIDGAGPARYLATSWAQLEAVVSESMKGRTRLVDEKGTPTADGPSKRTKHFLVVVDDPTVPVKAIQKLGAHDGVTVIAYRDGRGPDSDRDIRARELALLLDQDDRGAQIKQWKDFTWAPFCQEADLLDAAVSISVARSLARWDDGAAQTMSSAESQAAASFLTLLGVDNAANLDVDQLWRDRPPEEQLIVPLGLMPNGAPLWIDLNDEAYGGVGPHGLMIGMTGAGKSTTLTAMVLGLMMLNSPDVVQIFAGDFKDEAAFDQFKYFPHCVAVVSNMGGKRSLVVRLGDTLNGILDQRGVIFNEEGNRIKGSAFRDLREYNAARKTPDGSHLPPMPTMFVVIDEFTLMLKEHPHMAEVFDTITRKGRTLGVFFLFASQTLDEGAIKQIPANTQYRIGLKVASAATSRRVVGTEDAFHILPGKQNKGTFFFVRAPGAEPVRARGFMLPDIYEPPVSIGRKVTKAKPRARVFTAGRVEPDADTVIEEIVAGTSVLDGPPRSLVLTCGAQLAAKWTHPAPKLWSEPLDDPIPLDRVLAEARRNPPRMPRGVPWWPLGELDRPRDLIHELLTYNITQGHVLVLGANNVELTQVVQTFALAAAARYSPTDIGFYALSYGGSAIAALKELPHVGAIGGRDRKELTSRIFGDLRMMMARRRALFRDHDIASMEDYRRRRAASEPGLDDGYPVDIFVFVDGFEPFLEDNVSLLHPKNPHLADLVAITNSDQGVQLLVTAADTIKLGALAPKLTCRWELKIAPNSTSTVKSPELTVIRPQDLIPVGAPGRGLTMACDVIRFAVGRLDGQPTMAEVDDKVREAVATISAQHSGQRPAPAPELLARQIDSAALGARSLDGERYVLGQRGADLSPLVVDFADVPLMAVYGDPKMGKTATLAALIEQVVERRGQQLDQAKVVVFDPKRKFSEITQQLAEGHDYYESDPAVMAQLISGIDKALAERAQPTGLSWDEQRQWQIKGSRIYLFVDDFDAVPQEALITVTVEGKQSTRQVRTWAPLIPHLAKAGTTGLRLIVAHNAKGAGNHEVNQMSVPGQIASQRANRVLLPARAAEKIGGRKPDDEMIAGRAYVIAADPINEGHAQLALPHLLQTR